MCRCSLGHANVERALKVLTPRRVHQPLPAFRHPAGAIHIPDAQEEQDCVEQRVREPLGDVRPVGQRGLDLGRKQLLELDPVLPRCLKLPVAS